MLKNSTDMENFLSYELAPYPASLFQEGLMRKTQKSVLGTLLKSKVGANSIIPDNSIFVIDGGCLLHTVIWPVKSTYKEVCETYASYTEKQYGVGSTIVFDGYRSQTSTKVAEQQRRETKSISKDILFDMDMKTMTSQAAFLTNNANKARLIDMLSHELEYRGMKIKQAESDADYLIVSTSLSLAESQSRPVVVAGTDIDLLVMLISQAQDNMKVHMMVQHNPVCVYDVIQIQNTIGNVKDNLMFIHAATGCDTVSCMCGLGKKKAFDIVSSGTELPNLKVLTNRNSTHDEIETVGEMFLLRLYGAKKVESLDRYRYVTYNRMMSRLSLSSTFILEALPPTSAAAKRCNND